MDIPAKIQNSGGYIEQYPPEDMQLKNRGYDSYFKLFSVRYHIAVRPSAFETICDTLVSTSNNVK